jgi:hypothetical protein
MVLGGIIIPQENIVTFKDTMLKYRTDQNMTKELKWSKVSVQKIKEYKVFIDYQFALTNTNKAHFSSVIFDTHQINHNKHSDGDKEKGFYKFYYQLLLNCFARGYISPDNDVKFIIHLDHRISKYKLSDLKDILNAGIKKKLNVTDNRILNVQAIDSKSSDVLQIADILMGAIGYDKNGYMLLSGSNQGKIDLCMHIAKSAGLTNLKENTKWGVLRFKIWNFRFRA